MSEPLIGHQEPEVEEAPQNLGEIASVDKKKKAAGSRNRSKDEMLLAMMQQPQGRLFMWDLLGACNVFATSFSNKSLEMAFAEGQRNIGLMLLAQITRVCPELYVAMLREQGKGDDE